MIKRVMDSARKGCLGGSLEDFSSRKAAISMTQAYCLRLVRPDRQMNVTLPCSRDEVSRQWPARSLLSSRSL